MPRFVHPTERYVLSTSFKVMSSTLAAQPALRPIGADPRLLAWLYGAPRWRHHVLVRDPFDRLVSFYLDKLGPTGTAWARQHGWQRCQRLFFPVAGVSDRDRPDRVGRALNDISFEQFVGLLPRFAHRDPHLAPQVESLHLRLPLVPVGVWPPVDRVLRMERDLDFLYTNLRLDPSIHLNHRRAGSERPQFTPELRRVVERVYRRDFDAFGYARNGRA